MFPAAALCFSPHDLNSGCRLLPSTLLTAAHPHCFPDLRHSMLALARANSYAAPSEPDAVDAVPNPHDSGSLEPQYAVPAPSHGGLGSRFHSIKCMCVSQLCG